MAMRIIFLIALVTIGCDANLQVNTLEAEDPDAALPAMEEATDDRAPKLAGVGCVDPDLRGVRSDVTLTLCNGELVQGQMDLSDLKPENILLGKTIAEISGQIDLSNLQPQHILTGVMIAGVTGQVVPTPAYCSSDGGSSCVVDGTAYRAAKLANFTGANIASGVTIAGVLGSGAGEAHVDCAADGAVGCVTTSVYKAANTASYAASDIKSGKTIAGVAGGITNCADGDVGCFVAGPSFVAAASANVSAGNIKAGVVLGGVTGDYPSASHKLPNASATDDLTSLAASVAAASYEWWDAAGGRHTGTISDAGTIAPSAVNQTFSASVYRQFTVSGDADLVAGNIRNTVDIFGVTGNVMVEGHSNCATDGETGCVVIGPAFKAADMAQVSAGNIKAGVTIAGQAGNYPSASYPLAGADATADLLNGTFNAQVKSAAAFEYWDSTGARHTGAGDSDITAANVVDSVDIFGIVGTAAVESHNNCTGNAQQGCVTTATYKSADLTNLAAGNIKSGVTIAGQVGDYPSATNPLTGADATTDLPIFASTTGGASYEWFQSDGTRLTGSIQANQSVTASASDQILNTGLYRSVTVVGDANLVAAKIKNGVTLFGVVGDYPSSSNPLAGSDTTSDLTLATFDANVKSASSFEWFDQAGNRYTNSGDADIAAANIASGVSIFGTAGSLVAGSNCTGDGQTGCVTTAQYKSADTNAYSTWDIRKGKTVGGKAGDIVFYKNMIGTYNNSTAPAVASNDVWDTVDDYNNNGAFPTTAPSGWDQATGANWIMNPANDVGGGGGTAGDGLCGGSEACVFKDQITGLMWAQDDGSTYAWQSAITRCDGLSYGGYSDWRLPTLKELMQASINGIWSQKAANRLNLAASLYWSSSTSSENTSSAWTIILADGYANPTDKTINGVISVVCMR